MTLSLVGWHKSWRMAFINLQRKLNIGRHVLKAFSHLAYPPRPAGHSALRRNRKISLSRLHRRDCPRESRTPGTRLQWNCGCPWWAGGGDPDLDSDFGFTWNPDFDVAACLGLVFSFLHI